MLEIVEMNNQNKFNTKLLQQTAKTEAGAKVIAELFDLENPLERLRRISHSTRNSNDLESFGPKNRCIIA